MKAKKKNTHTRQVRCSRVRWMNSANSDGTRGRRSESKVIRHGLRWLGQSINGRMWCDTIPYMKLILICNFSVFIQSTSIGAFGSQEHVNWTNMTLCNDDESLWLWAKITWITWCHRKTTDAFRPSSTHRRAATIDNGSIRSVCVRVCEICELTVCSDIADDQQITINLFFQKSPLDLHHRKYCLFSSIFFFAAIEMREKKTRKRENGECDCVLFIWFIEQICLSWTSENQYWL